MANDADLKWSEYDSPPKQPHIDLVRVGQRTMLYRDMFTVSCPWKIFCNYKCPTVGSMPKKKTPRPLPRVRLRTVDETHCFQERGSHLIFPPCLEEILTFHPDTWTLLSIAKDVENTNYTSVHMTLTIVASI